MRMSRRQGLLSADGVIPTFQDLLSVTATVVFNTGFGSNTQQQLTKTIDIGAYPLSGNPLYLFYVRGAGLRISKLKYLSTADIWLNNSAGIFPSAPTITLDSNNQATLTYSQTYGGHLLGMRFTGYDDSYKERLVDKAIKNLIIYNKANRLTSSKSTVSFADSELVSSSLYYAAAGWGTNIGDECCSFSLGSSIMVPKRVSRSGNASYTDSFLAEWSSRGSNVYIGRYYDYEPKSVYVGGIFEFIG